MHHDLVVRHFKIKTPFLRAKAIERFPVSPDFSKALVVQMLQIIPGHFEPIQEFQLLQRVELGDFRRTDFVKDNL